MRNYDGPSSSNRWDGYYNPPNGYYNPPRNPQYREEYQQGCESPPRPRTPEYYGPSTNIHGLVIGRSKDIHKHYMFYSTGIRGGIARISRNVDSVFIGQWLSLQVCHGNFQGEFVLDYENCKGYRIPAELPDPNFCYSRFFPMRTDDGEGELVVCARFGVRVDHETNRFRVISYDIDYAHVIDPYGRVRESDKFYDGRSFIVELQAALNGWVVLKVHEDPRKAISCDGILHPVVGYDIQFLEEAGSGVLKLMTGDGIFRTSSTTHSNPALNRQDRPINSEKNHRSISSSHGPSDTTEESTIREMERTMSRSTITADPAVTSSSKPSRSEKKTEKETSKSPKYKQPEVTLPNEENDEDGTSGTANIPEREFIEKVSGRTLQRLRTETSWNDGKTQYALCTVVELTDQFAIMYTAKADVLNVMLFMEKCKGLDRPLRLGQSAMFEIEPRRRETQDELLPNAPYTHIAVRMKPITPEDQQKIDNFQKYVRCYGGLIEMKVEIKLTERGNVTKYYDMSDENRKEREFLYLHATNRVLVAIPNARLIHLLNSDMTADFDLTAWVVHRKPVGNVSLQIGKNGEAWMKYKKDGKEHELPPIAK